MARRLTLFKKQICRSPASIGGNCGRDRLPPLSLRAQVLRQNAQSVAAHTLDLEPDLFDLQPRGCAKLSLARYMAMYLVHVVFGLTHAEVGRMFHRDRTTSARAAHTPGRRQWMDRRIPASSPFCIKAGSTAQHPLLPLRPRQSATTPKTVSIQRDRARRPRRAPLTCAMCGRSRAQPPRAPAHRRGMAAAIPDPLV